MKDTGVMLDDGQGAMAAGDMVGSYRIISKLGEGGMGVVYLAEHPLIGRKAAVKVLHAEISAENPDVVTRFFNEARSSNLVNHPGIVNIFDSGYHPNGCAFLVMELLEGESLAVTIRRHKQMPLTLLVDIGRQIAGILEAAHGKMIVHRDLKPDNIFVVADVVRPGAIGIKVLDFGIAKLAGAASAMALRTQTGVLMGTPLYMSPEQCKGASSVDHRTDIYALGCMLFEMATGKPPFFGPSMIATLDAHMNEPPPSLAQVAPELPAELGAIVARAMAKLPEDRFPSMAAVAEALAAVPLPVAAKTLPPALSSHAAMTVRSLQPPDALLNGRPLTTLSSAASSSPNRPARPARWGWLVAVATLLVGAAGGWLVVRALTEAPPAGVAVAPAPVEVEVAPPPVVAPPRPVPPKTVTLRLESHPSGAEVFRVSDAMRLGRTPFEQRVPAAPGQLGLLLRLPGYHNEQVLFDTDSDRSLTVSLSSARSARPSTATSSTSTPSSTTKPKKRVEIMNPFEP